MDWTLKVQNICIGGFWDTKSMVQSCFLRLAERNFICSAGMVLSGSELANRKRPVASPAKIYRSGDSVIVCGSGWDIAGAHAHIDYFVGC